MHRDGEIVHGATEYWPTREQAQAVLDKFQFQPPHVWKRGDVFYYSNCIMVYWEQADQPRVSYMEDGLTASCNVTSYLKYATFLFNIKDKLGDHDAQA